MIQWFTLLPVLFPVLAALFRPLISHVVPRARTNAIILAIQIVLVALNTLPIEHRLVISTWASASFAPALEFDGTSFFLLTLLYVLLVAHWIIVPSAAQLDIPASLLLASATLLILAANLPAIYLAWVLLDASIFAWRVVHDIDRVTTLRSLVISQIGALLLFGGAQLLGTIQTDRGMILIGLAFWARMGLFPFHWVYPLRGIDSRDLVYSRAIPLLSASALWVRWPTFSVQPPGQLLAILGVLSIVASALWMWHEEHPPRAVMHGIWHAIPMIPLAVAYGGDAGSLLALQLVSGVTFSFFFFEIGLRWRAKHESVMARIFWYLGILSIAGIPLSPSLLGRLGMFSFLLESSNFPLALFITLLVAIVIAMLASYSRVVEGVEPRRLNGIERLGVVILLLAFLVCTIVGLPLASFFGTPISESTEAAVVFFAGNPILLFVSAILVSAPFLLLFPLREPVVILRSRPFQPFTRLAVMLDLGWLERLVTGVGYQTGATARNLAMIAEENPTVWILLVALWVAILTTLPR